MSCGAWFKRQIDSCSRNCQRKADGHYVTLEKGEGGPRQRPASQETCLSRSFFRTGRDAPERDGFSVLDDR